MSGPATVEVITSADAEQAQRRSAGYLRAAGLSAGDRVVFCLPSSSALLCAVLGALRVGVVPVLVNATLLQAERDQVAEDARPGLVVDDPSHLALIAAGVPVDLARYPLARPMHYTSGTTGQARGVWTGLWDDATAEAVFDDEADLWAFGPDDVHLVCSPMYHSVSIRFAGGTILRGGTCVILSRFDPEAAVRALLGRSGPVPTTAFLAPAVLHRLMATEGGPQALSSLRLLVHAGSPCPPSLKREVMESVGPGVLWEFYGSTEGQFTVCSPDEWLARPGTVGRARPGRTLSVDPDGTVWCRPPPFGRFVYWGDEEKTAAAWRDGAFTVGDLGRLDADGYLTLDGRRDDLVISGGVNVYPAEVEAALGGVAGLDEVAVFGVADEEWGQQVCAALVLEGGGRGRPGADPDRVVGAVRALAETRLAPYKRPKRYLVVAQLPRTSTGKVQRSRIAGMAGLE